MQLHSTLQPNLPSLIADYFERKASLKPLYSFAPSVEGIIEAAAQRKSFPSDRATLVKQLQQQAQQSRFTTKTTHEQIDRLQSQKVFTITTGHQLCIYGGPMFFLYKIASAIKTCQIIEEKGVKAVPVYWMASEDHDFKEVNHIFYHTQKVEWNAEARGPVGRVKLEGLEAFKKQLAELMGNDPLRHDTLHVMDQIFAPTKTLAEALRDLVYWLFADRGIIVLDADDRVLKELFTGVVKDELSTAPSFAAVNSATNTLVELGYSGQVTPREINLFWMQDGYRERIEKTDDGFATVDGKFSWSAAEMMHQAAENPESFSPNVVLRPVYQELILPNLAYIGGPGELSYWLQLKPVFDHFKLFYPAVLLRDMAIVLDVKSAKRLKQIDLHLDDLNTPFDENFTALVRKGGSHEHLVENEAKKVEEILGRIADSIGAFDPSLQGSAETEKTRILKRLSVLLKKVLRSDRRNSEVIERRLTELYSDIKPLNAPQERIENWLRFTTAQSKVEFIDSLLASFDPFQRKIKVFE